MIKQPGIYNAARLAQALYTCSQWWSDREGGISLYQLGSTHRIHSKEHRAAVLRDIGRNREFCEMSDDADMRSEVGRLDDLAELVRARRVGSEWLDDRTHRRVTECLYQRGVLGKSLGS